MKKETKVLIENMKELLELDPETRTFVFEEAQKQGIEESKENKKAEAKDKISQVAKYLGE